MRFSASIGIFYVKQALKKLAVLLDVSVDELYISEAGA